MPEATKRRSEWVPVFGLIVLSFIAATGYAQWHMHGIDTAALSIAENTAPSIERLASARGEMRQVQHLVREYRDRAHQGEPFDPSPYELARRRMDEQLDEYLGLPMAPGEHDVWTHIIRARASFDQNLTRFEAEAAHGASALVTDRAGEVATSADELGEAITTGVKLNAAHSLGLALEIRRVRTRTTILAFALDALCAIITVFAAVLLRRTMRSHADLAERHRHLHEERASEMERFAGRVAHDILSPLGTVNFALDLAGQPGIDDVQRGRAVERGMAALERVKRLVNGLLRFAKAGAKPEPGASADVAPTIADLVTDLTREATEADVELTVEHAGSYRVACDPGVLTSLVANLARNAIKYIGDGPTRRVSIRTSEKGDFVRFDVTDTGPGIPPGLEELVFEPYVRATSGKPGIGLGLATVKRVAEAHGGRVGVRSLPGHGCTFWFELPRARPGEAGDSATSGVVPSARIAG